MSKQRTKHGHMEPHAAICATIADLRAAQVPREEIARIIARNFRLTERQTQRVLNEATH